MPQRKQIVTMRVLISLFILLVSSAIVCWVASTSTDRPSNVVPVTKGVSPNPPANDDDGARESHPKPKLANPVDSAVDNELIEQKVVDQSTAFLFIGGRYVPPPYVVVIRGKRLIVNDIVVRELKGHGQFFKHLYQETPVEIPPQITQQSSWAEIDKIEVDGKPWAHRFWCYFFSHNDFDVALDKLQAALKELPFVASMEFVPFLGRGYLKVKSKAGDERDLLAAWWDPKEMGRDFNEFVFAPEEFRPYPRETVIKNLVKNRSVWDAILNENEFVFTDPRMWFIRINPKRDPQRWQEVINVVRILKSSLVRDQKVREILHRLVEDDAERQKGFGKLDVVEQLVDNFRPDSQLDARIRELEAKVTIPLWTPPSTKK